MDSVAAAQAGTPWAFRGSAAVAGGGGIAAAPNPRASRWSNGPAGPVSGVESSTMRRPPPAGLEPPFKRVRSDPQVVSGQGSADQGGDAEPAYGIDSGYGEGPPGLAYVRSTTVGGAQNHGVAGIHSYGNEYGAQQMPNYGQGGPQSYGSQHLPPQSTGFAPGSAKSTGPLFYKTKLCTKFKLGACTFNERCNFAHGMEDLRKPPPGWEDMASGGTGMGTGGRPGGGGFMGGTGQPRRTRICRYFMDGNCPYGDRCTFLHGNEEAQRTAGVAPSSGGASSGASRVGMRGPPTAKPNYKTRLCARWEKGEPCDFGDKCHFAHGPEELQRYTGVPTYPNGSNILTDAQYSSVNPEMTEPKTYTDSSMMNPPLAAPYGASVDYASAGPVAVSNLNSYASEGTVMKPLSSSQDVTNGASANYNYWDAENNWEVANATPVQPTMATQGYVQTDQRAPWIADYSVDGGYYRRENDTIISQYPQVQPQPQQSMPFFQDASAHEYQDSKQSVNPSYAHDNSQNKHQGEVRNGDGSYYNNAYSEANYASQQVEYNAPYHMAEAWGGRM